MPSKSKSNRQSVPKPAPEPKSVPEPSFEEQLGRLEEISSLLENNSIPMADLLDLYEEGMGLVDQCRMFLVQAEQRVTELQESELSVATENDEGYEKDLSEEELA